MMMRIVDIRRSVALIAIAGILAACAAPPHHRSDPLEKGSPHHSFGEGPAFAEPMEEALELTDEQAEALRRIRMDYDRMTIDRTAAIRVGEVELAALLDDENPDVDAIQQKVQAIGALRTELMMGRVTALLKLKRILTKGQYDAFQQVLLQRMESLDEHPIPLEH